MRWRVPLAVLGLCLLSVAGSVLAATDIRGGRLWRVLLPPQQPQGRQVVRSAGWRSVGPVCL